ncbi:unnamed protein product [Strongylus vulgaris]|uniref:Uncharacterized protein n=1 Tax=Strongylus vulgaris TaxID=40348 RepID=A0A3P7K781_STRVU|nr:unnamed protein product [Strongylus vulgaris]
MPTCLVSHGCSPYLGAVCPAGYTCTFDGRCCQIGATCPDGSQPEWLCSSTIPCPATHLCFTTEENHSICCLRDQSSPPQSACPPGSYEVYPRFGERCRYSLQCPSPYFCNHLGRCCQPYI